MRQLPDVRLIGTRPTKQRSSLSSWATATPTTLGTLLDKLGVAVPTAHCTQPIMDRYGIPGTVRASFALYNTREEVDQVIAALRRIAPMLA